MKVEVIYKAAIFQIIFTKLKKKRKENLLKLFSLGI